MLAIISRFHKAFKLEIDVSIQGQKVYCLRFKIRANSIHWDMLVVHCHLVKIIVW